MEDIKWLVGTVIGVLVLVGGYIVRDRAIFKAIREGDADAAKVTADVAKTAKEGDDSLHERVNRVRDEYVKRVDLDGHLKHLEKSIELMREDQRNHSAELNKRFDNLMAILSGRGDKSA